MDKTDKVNHKTLFLLDISAGFANKSSEQAIEFDVFTKSRTVVTPLSPITKSLWTCTVESVLEYSRIVWDLFPESDKLLSFLAFNENGCSRLNSWNDQSLHFLNNNFAQVALTINKNNKQQSNGSKDLMLLSAIQECLDQLATFSPLQWELYKVNKEVRNRGRLVLMTNFQNNSQVNNFIKNLSAAIVTFNKAIALGEELNETSRLPISELHLVMINTYPVSQTGSKINEIELTNVSGQLNCELFNSKSGTTISSKMITLLLSHYDLASTTVTNIPMKEEQNASSSANYDVEIVHSNQAHLDLLKNYLTPGEQMNLKSTKEDVSYDTVSLKWCTPKGSSVELHQCTGAYRITAVEINSRPSSCLINFLLGGRTVMLMLDMPRLKGKCMSHVLSSHSGELYIHTLGYNKSIIDDPPAISEGTGGRVTDYRINDFGELMRSMKLEKCKSTAGGDDLPLERAMHHLSKQTVYWPMTIGHSIIFNLSNQIQPLLSFIPKETLNAEEVNDCQTALYHLVAMENKNSPLPVPSAMPKNKGMKKEELYKLMWKELEYFIERHAITPEHNKVLNCLKELNSKFDTSKENLTGGPNASAKKFSLVDEFDRFNGAQASEKPIADLDMPDIKRAKLASDNPMNKLIRKSMISGSLSLYSLNAQRLELENTRKLKEFKGRQSGSNIAQLYANLNELKPENPL